jgi:hypothetical protein
MSYDADKTSEILEDLRAAMREGKGQIAMGLLRFADSSGSLRRDSGMLSALQKSIGEKQTHKLISEFATDPCPYCTNGREKCDDCSGRGYYAKSHVCAPCAGLGLNRCPFCNGTGFAGYDFVPRGLRPIVLLVRADFAAKQIAAAIKWNEKTPLSSREITQRIFAIDRCRGVLANAVEQSRLRELDGRSGFEASDRTRIERESRQQNRQAETAIRELFAALAKHYSTSLQNIRDAAKRGLIAHRIKAFAGLSTGDGLDSSSLRTPSALRGAHPL